MEPVVFDLDGCLVETETLHRHALSATLNRNITHEYFQKHLVGVTTREILTHFGVPHQAHQRMEKRKRELFNRLAKDVSLGGPARETLELLKSRGHKLALCSNNNLQSVFSILGEDSQYFDVIVSKDQTPRPKPHPDPYLLCFELMGTEPASVTVFEDAPSGVESATRAGAGRVVEITVHELTPQRVIQELDKQT